jgi:ubiquinone/menaquinone biosynthesis C-methylase UbiE
MDLNTAISLIDGNDFSNTPQHWADLGCGRGLFTRALASLLPAGSKVTAVDKKDGIFDTRQPFPFGVSLFLQTLDLEKDRLPFGNLDGILMANALHFIRDQSTFIHNIQSSLKKNGNVIILEYDTKRSSPWVPFPLSFDKLKKLFTDAGFSQIIRINSVRSSFNPTQIYGARIRY